ncbi:MAG: helix-turn-helix domain-containing protein [Pirellulales bacterium]
MNQAADTGKLTESNAGWTFLSNHAHVLLCIARDPEMTMKAISQAVGITERAVQRIVADLVQEEYLHRSKDGRRNRYSISANKPLRHPIEAHRNVDAILNLVFSESERPHLVRNSP